MKIGTDAMILSAWAEVSGANRVLDIGTGSGIIALMMAVRSSAVIDAVEIDEASVNEARDNFKQSPFSDRLQVFNKSMASFSKSVNNTYDVIISNPPFFINDMRPQNSRKQQARHTDSLSYSDLCFYSRILRD
jgi:tRNA1Val (adenine37-N6)-methyltransferase